MAEFLGAEGSLRCAVLADDENCAADAMASWSDARECGAEWTRRHDEFYAAPHGARPCPAKEFSC